MKKAYNKIKSLIKRFFLIDDTPHKVAGGAAVGIFMGIVPGEGVISTLVVTTILRFNRLAGTAGVLATNMWATLLVLPPAAFIGGLLFNIGPGKLVDDFKSTYTSGIGNFFNFTIVFQIVVPLMVGFIIAAGIIALIFYFLLYFLLKYKKIKFK
jgi:uncharacterized protein (DUF2062 family)